MPTKRGLITDTFKVVKKPRSEETKEREPPSLPETDPEPVELTEREKDLLELKKFDLDWQFGPCTGITRLQRWERAALHGLNPPQEIRDILLKRDSDTDYTQCLWHDYPL